MNGILALLLSMGFYVETVIGTHPSLLASLPHLSGSLKCIAPARRSLHLVEWYQVCPASAVLFMFPKLLVWKTLKKDRRKELKCWGFGAGHVKPIRNCFLLVCHVCCHCCARSQAFILGKKATMGLRWLLKIFGFFIDVLLADSINGITRE